MVKKEIYKGLGLDTDTAPNDRKTDVYWDAENIHIINNGRSLAIKPIKGETDLNIDLEAISWPYTPLVPAIPLRKVVGTVTYKDNLYFFTHTEAIIDHPVPAYQPYSVDELYKLSSAGVLTRLAYAQAYTITPYHWNLTYSSRLDCLVNYESDTIIKLYWVDGVNQLRYINIGVTTGLKYHGYNAVEVVQLASPTTVLLMSGGSLVAGSIQYVYNFYNKNGAQTALSPASSLLAISKTFNGYSSNFVTDLGVQVTIPVLTSGIYPNYEIVKIYSIHYLELNQSPMVKLVAELPIGVSDTSVAYKDYGNTFIAEYTIEDLLLISPLPIIPNTLATKRDRLFIGNYSLDNFNPDIDVRVYSYDPSSTSTVIDGTLRTKAQLDVYSSTADCINTGVFPTGNQKYKYNSAATVANLGATGYNFEIGYSTYTLPTTATEPIVTVPPKSLKKAEYYRLGIMFYNKYGQKSPVKWMADVRIPDIKDGTDEVATGISIKIVDSNAVSRLQAEEIVGYQLCIVERKPEDRTIVSQGFIVPGCKYTINGSATHYSEYVYPYYVTKELCSATYAGYVACNIENDYVVDADWSFNASPDPYPIRKTEIGFFYSTDTAFETNLPTPTHVRILGEAVGDPSDGNTILRVFKDGALQYHELITDSQAIWGVRSDPDMIYHIFDQTENIPIATTSVYQYEIVREIVYTDITRYDDATWEVTTLNTGYPAAIWLNSNETKFLDPTHTVRNATDFSEIIDINNSHIYTTYYNAYTNSMVLNFIGDTWHTGGSYDYDLFDVEDLHNAGTADSRRGIPIVELIRDISDQYGGNTYEKRLLNGYLPLGSLREINTSSNSEFIGDVWVGPLSINRSDGLDNKYQGQMCHYEYVYIHFVESNHNIYARKDIMQNYKYGLDLNINYRFNRIADNHNLFTAYNQIPNVFTQYPVPFNFTTVSNYPTTVLGSNVKTPNQLLDSWLVFPPNNIKHLEGQYGALTKLHNLAGEILAIQSAGIALLEIEPRVQTVDINNIGIQLGIGDLFYNHKYINTTNGTNRKFTVADDGKELYFYDDNLNIIYNLQAGKLSTLKTVKAILDAYPAGPITTSFNNNKAHIYFHYTEFTLVYDLLLQKFIAKYTFLNSNEWLVPVFDTLYQLDDSGTDVVINTQLTGEYKSSKLVYLLCPDSTYEKVFHNLEYRLTGNDFTTIKVNNDISSTATLVPDIKNKFDIHRIHLPRVQNSRERFRGIYIFVELNNTTDFSLDDLVLMYNIKG